MKALKNIIRRILWTLHLDITKNLKYDRYTSKILRKVIKSGHHCVDIGCHKGEMLDLMLKQSPKGNHIAFEPIPVFYQRLRSSFPSNVTIYPYALSDHSGFSTFQFVKNAPAYSGLKTRDYTVTPDVETIEVELRTLDELLQDNPVHFIKIDVEGGEYDVLKGALQTLIKNKPYVIFEFGLGASNHYGVTPEALFQLICKDAGLKISLLKSFLKNNIPLTMNDLQKHYDLGDEYYFIAHP